MKCLLRPLLLLALTSALPAQAIYLNPRGTGQVLLFPYYTVNAGQTTLLTLVNTTARAKWLEIEFREAYNSRKLRWLQIFLGPHDSWTGAMGSSGDSAAAYLLTRDSSCTAPNKPEWEAAPSGGWTLPMFSFAYDNDNTDGGPVDLVRTQEGHVAVFERAQLGGELAAAVDSDGPRQCQLVREIDTASPAVTPPGGGLAGRFAIVDVAQGTILGGSALAIDDFSRLVLSANSDPSYLEMSNNSPGGQSAEVFVDGRRTQLNYTSHSPPRAVDAFSAVLMADSLQADITREASVGSYSEWVLTAPSKHVYTDNQFMGYPLNTDQPAIAPYEEIVGGQRPGASCARFEAAGHDREGNAVVFQPETPPNIGAAPLDRLPPFSLCHTTDVVYFGPTPASGLTPVLASRMGVKVWNPQPAIDSGHAILSFAKRNDGTPRILRPDLNGTSLRGLPLIGFEAIKYVNGNVLPGVLANYTYALPLIPTTTCTNAQGGVIACP